MLALPSMTLQTQREIAGALLTEALARESRVSIRAITAAGEERGVSRRTLTRAARDLGLKEIHNGPNPGFWEKPS